MLLIWLPAKEIPSLSSCMRIDYIPINSCMNQLVEMRNIPHRVKMVFLMINETFVWIERFEI